MKLTFFLLRGLSRQQAHWGCFPKYLARALLEEGIESDFVFEDLPGFGARFQELSPSSIEEIARLLAPSLEKIPGQVHLLGLSMGGMLALELARRYPEKCQSLVMINSSVKPVARFYQRLQLRAYPAFLKAWFHPLKQASEQQILGISTEKYQQDEALLDTWLSYRKSHPPSRLAAVKQILAAARYQAPPQKPLDRVLLIASRKDRIASYRCTEQLAEFWGISPLIHATAGHDLPLDEPEWLLEHLVKWYCET